MVFGIDFEPFEVNESNFYDAYDSKFIVTEAGSDTNQCSKAEETPQDNKQYIELNMGIGIYDVNNPDFDEKQLSSQIKGNLFINRVSSYNDIYRN